MANPITNENVERDATFRLAKILQISIVILLAAVGCAAVIGYSVAHWAERQILTTDNWVATVAPLPQTPVVASALSNYVTTQIFANVPVQQEITDALPPKAAFLASPLTSQLQSLTNKIANRVITSDNFETVWTVANRTAMNRLTSNARGQTQPLGAKLEQKFSLNLNDIKSTLQSKLGTSASALPALNTNGGKALTISTDLKAKRERVWGYIRDIDYLSAVLPFVVIASFLGALAFARNRRRALLAISGATIVLLLLELIAIKSLHQEVLNQVKVAGNQPAISYIFDTLTSSLKTIIYTWLIGWVLIAIGSMLVGPARWAVALRALLHVDSMRGSVFAAWWHSVRLWTKKHLYYLWVGAGLLLLIWLAFAAQVNNRLVSNSVLVALSVLSITYIIANPHIVKPKR